VKAVRSFVAVLALVAAWGSSSFILAWEDLAYNSGDKDFNDFVLYVESVTGVSEPSTLASLALALLALGAISRRRFAR